MKKGALLLTVILSLLLLSSVAAYGLFSDVVTLASSPTTKANLTCSLSHEAIVPTLPGNTNYWKLNDSSGTITPAVGSVSGTATNITYSQPQARTTLPGTSVTLAGDSKISFGDIADYANQNFTISLWAAHTGDLSTTAPVLTKSNTSSSPRQGWGLEIVPGGFYRFSRWVNGTVTTVSTTTAAPAGSFQHIAVTYDSEYLLIFNNGVLQDSAITTGRLADTTAALTVGQWSNTSTGGFVGSIDDISLYTSPQSILDVDYLATNCSYTTEVRNTSGLASYWRFDEEFGPDLFDSTSTEYDGAPNSTITFFPGQDPVSFNRLGYSAGFSSLGTSGASFGNYYGFTNKAPFTVEAWVHPNAAVRTNSARIVAKSTSGGSKNGWDFSIDPNTAGLACARWRNGSSTGATSTTPVPLDTWSHVACTYDGTNVRVYMNGVLQATGPSSTNMSNHSNQLTIGSASTGENGWDGKLDDVAIYTSAISLSDIQRHYNAR